MVGLILPWSVGMMGTEKRLELDFMSSHNNLVSSTTHNFTNVNFGAANPNRVIVVGFLVNTGTNRVSSVTIGGISAPAIVTPLIPGTMTMHIHAAAVPTGTTGTITLNLTAIEDVVVSCFRMIRTGANTTPTNSGSTSVISGTISLACTVPSTGAGIVIIGDDDDNPTHTGTNYTEYFDRIALDNDTLTGGIFTTSATLSCYNTTINTNDKGLLYVSWEP